MAALKFISNILVIVGGINWGLVGIFKFNLVDTILAPVPMLARFVYVLVGLAAVYLCTTIPKMLR